jgi:toxin ParE1/3/4
MRSSRRLEFTAEAEADFRSLLEYTTVTWGVEQRDLYADRMMSVIHELLSHTQLGSVRDDVSPGLRNRRVGQHLIFYRVYERSIRIVRILHTKMDPAAHVYEPPRKHQAATQWQRLHPLTGKALRDVRAVHTSL